MSTPPPPPSQPTNTAPQQPQTLLTIPTGLGVLSTSFLLIPFFLLLAFHLGAGYLSYQKYGNMGWAFLNFIFAYFYYPYYAFFLAKEPAPSALPAMVGGKAMKGLGKMLKGVFSK
jgi:hypothetical protein